VQPWQADLVSGDAGGTGCYVYAGEVELQKVSKYFERNFIVHPAKCFLALSFALTFSASQVFAGEISNKHQSALSKKADLIIKSMLDGQAEEDKESRIYKNIELNLHPVTAVLFFVSGFGGGNNYHSYMAVFGRSYEQYRFIDVMKIGEKTWRHVKFDSIAQNGHAIEIDTLEYSDEDANCCPSIKKKAYFVLNEHEQLIETSAPAIIEKTSGASPDHVAAFQISKESIDTIKPERLAITSILPTANGAKIVAFVFSPKKIADFMGELEKAGSTNIKLADIHPITVCGKRLVRAEIQIEGDSSQLVKSNPSPEQLTRLLGDASKDPQCLDSTQF
jgi:hypothetical protein